MNITPAFTRYRVAAIQFDPVQGEKEQNIQRLLRLIEEAAGNKARLIVLPEMVTTGYCWESREEIASYVEPIPGPTTHLLHHLASIHNCYIALSLPEVDPNTDVYYNTLALIGPEGVIGTYRKIHSYISEPRWARDGDGGMPVWETPLGKLAGLICMDAMYFEAARIPVLHGAEVLLFPTNWLDDVCPSSWWMTRAFENGVYLIAANRSGQEKGILFSGGSCILNPDGSIQAYRDSGEGIVYGDIDLDRSRNKSWGSEYQAPIGNLLTDRRPGEYVTLVNNTYLWEPLRYHGLYQAGELPPGQLSCVAIVQVPISSFFAHQHIDTVQSVQTMVATLLREHDPTRPDVLVLPELLLPGPPPSSEAEEIISHFHHGAITLPGPETEALVELARTFQISLVLGVAEKEGDNYYNTILLIDPEGIYGQYRKLHLTVQDALWAKAGNKGLPTFDIPTGRIGLATGYDILFPETLRVLAGKGADLVCAPTWLNFPEPVGLAPSAQSQPYANDQLEYDTTHSLIWRVRAAEQNLYLAVANWEGHLHHLHANGHSGIFSPSCSSYPCNEVIADPDELSLSMMTIDTREQRTGRRSTTSLMDYVPGDMAGSLTGELAYDIRDTIPGNVVRSKPLLRKRVPFWYLDLVRREL